MNWLWKNVAVFSVPAFGIHKCHFLPQWSSCQLTQHLLHIFWVTSIDVWRCPRCLFAEWNEAGHNGRREVILWLFRNGWQMWGYIFNAVVLFDSFFSFQSMHFLPGFHWYQMEVLVRPAFTAATEALAMANCCGLKLGSPLSGLHSYILVSITKVQHMGLTLYMLKLATIWKASI